MYLDTSNPLVLLGLMLAAGVVLVGFLNVLREVGADAIILAEKKKQARKLQEERERERERFQARGR